MSSRTGVLSDIEINKHCAMHRPVPFNRLDLLIPNLKNVSGVYSRKLKELKVLSRPATAYEMIMELQRLNPKVDIMAKYEEMLQRPAPVLQPRQRPADDLSRETQPITQQYYERPNIADLAYMDLADLEGLLANIMEGTTWGGTERGTGIRPFRPTPSAIVALRAEAEALAQDLFDANYPSSSASSSAYNSNSSEEYEMSLVQEQAWAMAESRGIDSSQIRDPLERFGMSSTPAQSVAFRQPIHTLSSLPKTQQQQQYLTTHVAEMDY